MTESLEHLIARRDQLAAQARDARSAWDRADQKIRAWGKDQVVQALQERGVIPGKSIVRMKVRITRKGRIVLEETTCLLEGIGRVDPPTMERDALGPNACSSDMWWCAHINWRNIRKDGTPGAHHDFCVMQGDTVSDLVGKIAHVRDLP